MEKVKIARKDMSISKISEKILKISEDYKKAKEDNNKKLMEELKKEYEYQKAVLNASENFFAKYDEKEMKDKANYSSDEEEVKRAKWILKNKKEYQDKEDLFDAIIASKSLEKAKDVIEEAKEENEEKNKKHGALVFRKFKKGALIIGSIAALAIGGLVGCNLTKRNKDKQNPVRQEQTAEMDDLTDNLDSTTEQTTKEKTTENVKKKSFNNDEIKTDESYKNLKYKGNGETIDDYAEKNGVPTSGKPEDTVTTREIPNVSLPSKPEDTVKTVVIPEKVEPTTEDTNNEPENKTDDSKTDDNKNDKEKVTIIEKEEKPSDNDPSKVEESKDNNKTDDTKKDENKKEEPTTEDNTPKDTEEKPDFKEPEIIEEDDNDITYLDGDKNSSTEAKEKATTEEPTTEKPTTEEPTTEKPTTEEPTTEDNTPKDTEEKPDFKEPEIIEEDENDVSYISSLKNNYIALKAAIMTELANMNQSKSVENEGLVLTYTSSKNC